MKAFFAKHKRLFIALAAIVVIAVLFLVFRPKPGAVAGQYQTEAIARGNLTATVGATGTVHARQSANLVWETTGKVEKVNVKVGDQVTAGQVLANLAKTSLPQNIILAEADLVSAQKALNDLKNSDTARAQAFITLRDASDSYDKAKNYRESLNGPINYKEARLVTEYVPGVGPIQVPKVKTYKSEPTQAEIDKADADLALAEAKYNDAKRAYDRIKDGPNPDDLAAAQARVDAAQATLEMATIKAPFAGTVTEADPLVGDEVSAGTRAFRIDDLSSLQVDVDLSEVDINSVSVGQAVTLSFDAILGKTYNGKVITVSQAGIVSNGIVNFTVTVELSDADEMVKPGMTAAVNIVVKEIKDAVLVPNRAVRLVNNNYVVYILQDGAPKQVSIRLGSSSDTMSVVVGGDLKVGDMVILNPPAQFQPGGGPGGGGPFGG